MNEEEELKEEVDRYERQNQEAYDLEIENEIKRKREAEAKYKQLPLFTRLNDAIEGKLDQFGQFVSEAAEDKPGISDDIVRGGLNTLQTIGNLPVIKQLGQAEEAIVGGVRNLAERQDLIDPRSFTYSTRIGTALIPYGGAVKALSKTKKVSNIAKPISGATDDLLRQQAGLKMRLLKSIDPDDPTAAFPIKGGGSLPDDVDLGSFLLNKRNRYNVADEMLRKAQLNPKSPYYKRLRDAARNVPEFVRRNEDGFLYFDYNLFKDSMRPKQHGRAYIQLFESDLDTVLNPANFAPDAGKGTKTFREFDIAEFRETFRPAAELLGLTGKKTLGPNGKLKRTLGRMDVSNVHHIAALKGIMGIYDGLGFNSPLFKKVNAAMKESIGGMGAERANLIRLVGGTADKGSPHQLAHFFLDEALGTRGENFFTDDVLLKMNMDDSYRISKARELGKIVADSEKIALRAQEAYKRLADAALATDFKDIQNTLERLVTSKKLGFVKLNNVNYKPIIRETAERGGYNVRQFDELIEDIALIHKAVPTGSPKLIDELLFSPQLLKSQKSFQKLVIKIEERFGEQGVTGAQMRKILDAYDVRMQNAGLGQTGLFEDIPDNLIEDTLNSLNIKIKAKKTRASKRNQEKYKQDPDIN